MPETPTKQPDKSSEIPTDPKELRKWRARQRYADSKALQQRKRIQASDHYANMTAEQRESRRVAQRTPTSLSVYTVTHSDGTTTECTPEMSKYLARISRKRELANKYRDKRWADIAASPVPPNLQRRMEHQEIIQRLTSTPWVNNRCQMCQQEPWVTSNWRIIRRDDPADFQPTYKSLLLRIENNIEKYGFICSSCAIDLRLVLFEWIFSPFSPRNDEEESRRIRGDKPLSWIPQYPDEVLKAIYPPGETPLRERIKSGLVKSLSCTMLNVEGETVDSFIKMKHKFYRSQYPGDCTWQKLNL